MAKCELSLRTHPRTHTPLFTVNDLSCRDVFDNQVSVCRSVKWVPCQHGFAHPQVAYGGEGLQKWEIAANILHKKLRTADKG
jgi:hypothetical protein